MRRSTRRTYTAAANDSLAFTDVADAIGDLQVEAADIIVFGDTSIAGLAYGVSGADAATFGDSADAANYAQFGLGEDGLTFHDAAESVTQRVAAAVDALALSDTAASISQRLAAAADAVTFADAASATGQSDFPVTESPTLVIVTPGNDQLGVSWQGPAALYDGGDIANAPVSSYTVIWGATAASVSDGGTPLGSSVPIAPSATTYTITGLANATLYYVAVYATNSAGDSQRSQWTTGTTT